MPLEMGCGSGMTTRRRMLEWSYDYRRGKEGAISSVSVGS